jgi:hypothetical protein
MQKIQANNAREMEKVSGLGKKKKEISNLG